MKYNGRDLLFNICNNIAFELHTLLVFFSLRKRNSTLRINSKKKKSTYVTLEKRIYHLFYSSEHKRFMEVVLFAFITTCSALELLLLSAFVKTP